MNRSRIALYAILLAAFAVFSTGCKKDQGGDGAMDAQPTMAEPASIRVIHAADAGAVDVLVDGSVAISSLDKYTFTTSRADLPAGQHTIAVNAAGTSTEVLSFSANLVAGMDYTVAVVGNGSVGYEVVVAQDQLDASNAGSFRAIHGVPGANGVSIATEGGDVLAASVNYMDASGYLNAPAGTSRLSVMAGDAVVGTAAVPFNDSRIVTVVVVPEGDGIRFINVLERTR